MALEPDFENSLENVTKYNIVSLCFTNHRLGLDYFLGHIFGQSPIGWDYFLGHISGQSPIGKNKTNHTHTIKMLWNLQNVVGL